MAENGPQPAQEIEELLELFRVRRDSILEQIASLAVQKANLQLQITSVEQQIAAQVMSATSLGITWREIGQTLGISQQGAHKRFATPSLPPSTDTGHTESE